MSEPSRSVPKLAGDALREAQELVSKEIKLLRTEMAEGLHHLTLAVGLLMAAGVLVLTALLVWIFALVKAVGVVLQSDALAALIVGGVFAIIAIGLTLCGRSNASLSRLELTRTERQLRQDAAIIMERVEG